MASSFQKHGKPSLRGIPGTKLSSYNTETVLSCGIPALDYVLGGGLPFGSVLLVEEDTFATYCKQLLKYYVAEGIERSHLVYLATAETDPLKFLKGLPRAVYDVDLTSDAVAASRGGSDGDLKIAFRYEGMPKQESLPNHENAEYIFDFAERIESAKLAAAQITTFDPRVKEGVSGDVAAAAVLATDYVRMLSDIAKILATSKGANDSAKNAVRIVLHGLGSPALGSEQSLPAFFHALKSLVRGETASVFATVPSVLAQHHSQIFLRCQRSSHAVLKLQSFDDIERCANPLYKNYHGLLQVVKLSRMTSLSLLMPDCDFLFHQRSKKFLIEKLHLPPDLGVDDIEPRREAKAVAMACASNQKYSF